MRLLVGLMLVTAAFLATAPSVSANPCAPRTLDVNECIHSMNVPQLPCGTVGVYCTDDCQQDTGECYEGGYCADDGQPGYDPDTCYRSCFLYIQPINKCVEPHR